MVDLEDQSMSTTPVIDKQRERPTKPKATRGCKTLCRPTVLRLVIGAGRTIFLLLKVVIELIWWLSRLG
jgi:hypothetical protein